VLALSVEARAIKTRNPWLPLPTAPPLPIPERSDDPAYFLHSPSGAGGTYINANFLFLARCAGLGPRQLAEIAAQGFRSSFLDTTAKRKHEEAVWAALVEWEAAGGAATAAA
jgi:hypothetical protein